MHHPRRAQIANRIHLALMRELGQGIDLKLMLHSALYARDVLLVCQAYPGSELQQLGPGNSPSPPATKLGRTRRGPAAGDVTAAGSASPGRRRRVGVPTSMR
jgi:hypothetical protein